MKERPILFSGPMVRAILEGRKTQTRRVLKGLPPDAVPASQGSMDVPAGVVRIGDINGLGYTPAEIKCPYGKPGDHLWVRETWGDPWHHAQPSTFYRATDEEKVGWHPEFDGWSPSIHMKRERSRITLEVVRVRVERLQEISEEDAKAEGAPSNYNPLWEPSHIDKTFAIHGGSYRFGFEGVWKSINGCDSWEANPWVWVVEFKLIKP